VAERAYDLAQYLAAVGARLERRAAPTLPRLADVSVGDQVAVVGHDVVAGLRAVYGHEGEADEARLGADERELADRMLRDCLAALKDLRREL
jgi:hypothetical protein